MGEQVYFVMFGRLEYTQQVESVSLLAFGWSSENSHPEATVTSVSINIWICELAFWVIWTTRGWIEAVAPTELLAVSVKGFVDVLTPHPQICEMVQRYRSAA